MADPGLAVGEEGLHEFTLLVGHLVDAGEEGLGLLGEVVVVVEVELQPVEGDHEAAEAVEEDPVAGQTVDPLGDVVEDHLAEALQGGHCSGLGRGVCSGIVNIGGVSSGVGSSGGIGSVIVGSSWDGRICSGVGSGIGQGAVGGIGTCGCICSCVSGSVCRVRRGRVESTVGCAVGCCTVPSAIARGISCSICSVPVCWSRGSIGRCSRVGGTVSCCISCIRGGILVDEDRRLQVDSRQKDAISIRDRPRHPEAHLLRPPCQVQYCIGHLVRVLVGRTGYI